MSDVNNSSKLIGTAIDRLTLQVSRLAWAVEWSLRCQLPSGIIETPCRGCGSMLVVAGDPKCGACGSEMEVPGG